MDANPGGKVGRGVPDIAGDADPNTGYIILLNGKKYVFGGTSAVAPLWSGLIAFINQKLGKPVGYLNPLLYNQLASAGVFKDITNGNNGFVTVPFYNASGLGSVHRFGFTRWSQDIEDFETIDHKRWGSIRLSSRIEINPFAKPYHRSYEYIHDPHPRQQNLQRLRTS